MSQEIPLWLTPVQLELWPTQTIHAPDLHYCLSIRQGWNPIPTISQTPMEIEHSFRGVYPSEWLIVSFMGNVDPKSDIRSWVDAFLQLTGFPIFSMQQASQASPNLLEWQYLGSYPPVTDRLGVDEAHCYQGLAQLPEQPPELVRLYILLARRDTFAWKVSLSLMSACPPGSSEEMVATNDHVRAGATFGTLQLR
jgi:hypothetical protein